MATTYKYEIVNASDGVYSRAAGTNGDGMVQPNTRRVLSFDEEIPETHIDSVASSGVFIRKSTAAAQNGQPLPGFDEQIAAARRSLMVSAGQEREDIIKELWSGKPGKMTASDAADTTAATTAAPASTPAPTGR